MAGNVFGKILTLSSFGESHGPAIGGMLDGMPPGIPFSEQELRLEMERRRPGQSELSSPRDEKDPVRLLSGVKDGKTTGLPIGFIIENQDARPSDYQHLRTSFRPSHADYTYLKKYGTLPTSGGGRASARETAVRVAAGYFAKQLLRANGVVIKAYVHSVGHLALPENFTIETQLDQKENDLRCPDSDLSEKMGQLIDSVRKKGDSLGGCIQCEIFNCPAGLGEPVFDKLQADLAKAMLSINACKAFEYGSGFRGTQMRGSQHNDPFETEDGQNAKTTTNFSGGIQGGISNGMPIYFKLGFKPVSTINIKQTTLNTSLEKTEIEGKGRHDPCVVPRAVPIVEAMAALVLADHLLRNKLYSNK